MIQTYIPSQKHKEINWFIIDATDKILGRLSTQVANLIEGKNEVTYTPGFDSKIHVIIINVEKIKVTGNKLNQKFYYSHTGKPGELRKTALIDLQRKHPNRVIELAIKRMLPDGFAKSNLSKRLRIYSGNNHPHLAQKPRQLTLSY
uniref:Ribosomal protein L13 n=1 Tax=Pseudellipsoidion edaphicum TaxID=1431838 RepID=A0A410D2H5_9STRA|nr:ribosomal protein L13 [Pseudellipsoidion edaphicum]QAA11941.1 ribosomal protein L13 [Pseudellipsoidion edaphicum]